METRTPVVIQLLIFLFKAKFFIATFRCGFILEPKVNPSVFVKPDASYILRT